MTSSRTSVSSLQCSVVPSQQQPYANRSSDSSEAGCQPIVLCGLFVLVCGCWGVSGSCTISRSQVLFSPGSLEEVALSLFCYLFKRCFFPPRKSMCLAGLSKVFNAGWLCSLAEQLAFCSRKELFPSRNSELEKHSPALQALRACAFMTPSVKKLPDIKAVLIWLLTVLE